MSNNRFILLANFLVFLLLNLNLIAQIGGNQTFQFLNLPYNARSAALGNDFITVRDQDLNLGVQNPSLYNSKMDKKFGFNQAILASGINYGMLNYARSIDTIHTISANIRYVNYGNMDRMNEAGVNIGSFNAADFIIGVGASKSLNKQMSIGTNVNLIYSQLDNVSSFGIGVDFAAAYQFDNELTFLTVVAKNVGYQLKSYQKGNRYQLPTEAQIGISHKLKHAPFRFSILFHQLNKFDLTYNDLKKKREIDPLTGDTLPLKRASFIEKTFRHLTYQVEILLGKNLHLRAAFDYHRRQELKVTERPGIAGFSFGVGMYFKRFSLDYGLIAFSAAGYSNLLTLNLNLDKLKR
jgi:hypothetical protein